MDTSVKWPPIAGVMSFKLCAQISFYIENKTCQISSNDYGIILSVCTDVKDNRTLF